MQFNTTWPFKSKISKLEKISKDSLGNIDLVLDNKSLRFHEKEIISTNLKADFFSTINDFKSKRLPNNRQWIWDNLWQIFLSFIFSCGFLNCFINYRFAYFPNDLIIGFLILFGLFLIIFFIFLGYIWHILKRYLISKYAPFFMENDIIEIRLHNLTIQFRCISLYSLQEVKNTIDIRKDNTGSIFEKKELVVLRSSYPYSGVLVNLFILLFFVLLFYLNSENPTWWYVIFNIDISPNWLKSYGENFGALSEKYINYFRGDEKGFFKLFFDGMISGIGLFLLSFVIILCIGLFILLFFLFILAFVWQFFFLFGFKEKLNRKIWWVLLIVSFIYLFFTIYIVSLSDLDNVFLSHTTRKNFITFNLLVVPVSLVLGIFIGLIYLLFDKSVKKEIFNKTKNSRDSILMCFDLNDSVTIEHCNGQIYTLPDFQSQEVPIIDDQIPYFKLSHLFDFKHIDFDLINELKDRKLE